MREGNMNSVDVNNREASKKMKFDYKSKVGCAKMCGLCPACVFAPKPAGRTQCLWKVTDGHRRSFVVELLIRCKNTLLLESIQNMLSVTSWTLFLYGRARVPPRVSKGRTKNPAFLEEPPDVDMKEIWDWFSSCPDWIKSLYLCRLFSLCDSELLRTFANLTNVLLATLRAVQRKLSSCNTGGSEQDKDEDSEDPAVMVDLGSSRSMSGVSRYRDFVGCLPVNLSKSILGLLEEPTLKSCLKVCRRWHHLVKETMEDKKFRRHFQDQTEATMNKYKGIDLVLPAYANIVEVHVPTHEDEKADSHSSYEKIQPFESAYAKFKTKFVQMEERNVYCGAHFAKVLLMKEDPHRVLDYRGRAYMATASKDCAAILYYVASEAVSMVSVMKGHVGTIRAVLLCEDRNLVITASCDASIRCWNLKTDLCEIVLYGHTGTVNCLDVHADRLVSGSKDCTVKVWNLQTGKHLQGFNFKHPNSIQCVKINTTKVFSSCDRGLVKIWNLEKASILRVIDAHRSPVKCLFFDEWHLLSGDVNGQVMVWSTNCQVKECLRTFSHPKEVKSLALIYLRVVTGCVDGKIRIFDFLTGDCLRDITVEPKPGCILSLHFLDNSILINTISCVKVFHFSKVFWDYPNSAEEDQSMAPTQDGESAASIRKVTFNDAMAEETSPGRRIYTSDSKKPEIAELLKRTHFLIPPSKCQTQVRQRCKTAPQSGGRTKKATGEQTNKWPLRANTSQNAQQGTDEVDANDSIDNSNNTDSWSSCTPQDSLCSDSQALRTIKQSRVPPLQNTRNGQARKTKSRVQGLERDAGQNAGVTMRKHHRSVFSGKAQPPSADVPRAKGRVGAFTASAKKQPKPSA